jgi:chromosome segregation ATPase
MAKKETAGNGRLEEAMAMLIQNQASFLSHMAKTDERMAKTDERMAKTDERMAKTDERRAEIDREIAERFARIEALLLEHNRLLQALPEAVRAKIGFQSTKK